MRLSELQVLDRPLPVQWGWSEGEQTAIVMACSCMTMPRYTTGVIDLDWGVADDGDPWCVLTHRATSDVLVTLAREIHDDQWLYIVTYKGGEVTTAPDLNTALTALTGVFIS